MTFQFDFLAQISSLRLEIHTNIKHSYIPFPNPSKDCN